MQELFDNIVAEMKSEIMAFKSTKDREAKIRGLATIASIAGSIRTIIELSEDEIVNGERTTKSADDVVLWCIKQVV